MNEYYCPGKKPAFEHDRECYYHGNKKICPKCGMITRKVIESEYKPITCYSLREIGGK